MTVVGVIAEGEDPWELPAAWPVDHGWVTGGLRRLFRTLAAAALAGERAEIRGPVAVRQLAEVCQAAGADVAVPARPRAPRPARPRAPRSAARSSRRPSGPPAVRACRRGAGAPPAGDGPAGLGAHELYAVLAAAAAAAGERAELRGPVDRRLLARTGAAVDLPATARMPEGADVVVVLARGEIGRLLADERLGLLGLANEAGAQAAAGRGTTGP